MRVAAQLFLFVLTAYPFLQCSKDNHRNSIPADTIAANAETLLALGDSYTIGQSVEDSARFPAQAARMLNTGGINMKAPDYVAQTGWTTTDLLEALDHTTIRAPYDYVTLLIGVNNQFQGMDIRDYSTGFTQLLNKSIRYAGDKPSHVMVVSIPDYSITPIVPAPARGSISAAIDAYNSINRAITQQNGCKYLDISALYRQGENDPALIAADHLHPSGREYAKWAMLVSNYIQTLQ